MKLHNCPIFPKSSLSVKLIKSTQYATYENFSLKSVKHPQNRTTTMKDYCPIFLKDWRCLSSLSSIYSVAHHDKLMWTVDNWECRTVSSSLYDNSPAACLSLAVRTCFKVRISSSVFLSSAFHSSLCLSCSSALSSWKSRPMTESVGELISCN